jgi:hypothetical protein
MRSRRSALPLPRYTLRKSGKHGWGYYFNVPSWARVAGCPLHNQPLGSDYRAAVERAETVLLPIFDSWRSGEVETKAKAAPGAVYRTLDWLFAEFRSDRRFTDLDTMTLGAITKPASAWSAAIF